MERLRCSKDLSYNDDIYFPQKSTLFKERFDGFHHIMMYSTPWGFKNWAAKPSQNGQIPLFTEIYINLLLFRKYVEIYHFLGTRVFHSPWVPWTRIPWKNFENFLWYLSSIKNILANFQVIFSKNSNTQKVVDPYIFLKQW